MESPPHVVEDCLGVIQIFSDGSIYRQQNVDLTSYQVKDDGSVIWKDYCYDKLHDLRLRIYKPKSTTTTPPTKLPVIYYLHGGGFCGGSFSRPTTHNCLLRLSVVLHAVIVAPDYRLAPENRLPAAMDDSLSGLKWLQTLAKDGDRLVECFDFDRFFVIGDSSGGNIAHHLAVQLGPGSPELTPIKIRGYVMVAPFFGGKERTTTEAKGRLPGDWLNIDILDTFWRMSLPVGTTADHPFANPFGPESLSLESVDLDPILVFAGGDEIMKDRVKLYADRLKEIKKTICYIELEAQKHGFLIGDPYSDVSASVFKLIKDFIVEHSS